MKTTITINGIEPTTLADWYKDEYITGCGKAGDDYFDTFEVYNVVVDGRRYYGRKHWSFDGNMALYPVTDTDPTGNMSKAEYEVCATANIKDAPFTLKSLL